MKEQAEYLPRPAGVPKGVLDPTDTVICLLDHQTGLFQTVKANYRAVMESHAKAQEAAKEQQVVAA